MDFARSATLYDAVYRARGKDYADEAERLRRWLPRPGAGRSIALLDVGCGTGEHLRHLRRLASVIGFDCDGAMLAQARRKLSDSVFVRGDMCSFALGRSFDAVSCLFASIGYLDSEAAARAAIACMSRHVSPGGVLLLEPPLGPERLCPPERSTLRFTHQGTPVERVTDASHEPGRLRVRFDYRVGDDCFSEEHAILALPLDVFADAMEQAELEVEHDPTWPSGPGLLIGRKPTA